MRSKRPVKSLNLPLEDVKEKGDEGSFSGSFTKEKADGVAPRKTVLGSAGPAPPSPGPPEQRPSSF